MFVQFSLLLASALCNIAVPQPCAGKNSPCLNKGYKCVLVSNPFIPSEKKVYQCLQPCGQTPIPCSECDGLSCEKLASNQDFCKPPQCRGSHYVCQSLHKGADRQYCKFQLGGGPLN